MRLLTEIDKKTQSRKPLTSAELRFLYEIDGQIEGFGYDNQGRDPRIAELCSQRNTQEDMLVVFGCEKSQIAHSVSQISPDTKAYVGKLEPRIFDKLPRNIEHVYTSFPEGKIRRETIEIGGKSAQQLETELKQAGVNISEYAEDMLHNPAFTTLQNPQSLDTVRLKVQDLGLTGTPTTDQVYARAKELGLDLCPAEIGPRKRLKDVNQPTRDWYYIAMKQIAGRVGYPDVFVLARGEGGLWLGSHWALPGFLVESRA